MRYWLHIFVFFAFLNGVIAPACGFAWGGKYSVVEICTAQGIESRVVDNQSQPDTPNMKEQCQFCFSQANLKNIAPLNPTVRNLVFTIEKAQFRRFEEIYLSHARHNHTARGPPTFI